jgi:lipopolysaccharide export system permease protein
MKKIDRLLISSFIPPFIVTFSIAMFVLVMQVLWLYIDDIAGKGLGFFLIIELLGYKCVSLVPLALPLAILISSVMVLGNMAEKYELSSLKSAGVSLWRVMRPLMVFGILAVFSSFLTSNNLIPVANLKFGSRMYDIQKQKPALRLDAGVFNDDFDGYAIHIGHKRGDATIEEVLIYDHSDATKGRLSQIIAEQGEMYATDDGRYFMMQLQNGHQYVESEPRVSSQDRSYPFIRTNFKSWTKVFDLSEFDLNRTNEELFTSNRSMMTSGQLKVAVDSIDIKIRRREVGLSNQISGYFHYLQTDSTFLKQGYELSEEDGGTPTVNNPDASTDSTETVADSTVVDSISIDSASVVQQIRNEKKPAAGKEQAASRQSEKDKRPKFEGRPLDQEIDKDLAEYSSFLELFLKTRDRGRLMGKAKSTMRSIQAHSESAVRSLDRMRESRVKHIYELHTKYSMAVVCFIFLFIGAPMGAIVRKGGFGYPILISIIFFMVFIVLTIFCRKIAETFVLPAAMAAWVPCAVLFPIGLLLTTKAMNDSKLVNPERYLRFISLISKLLRP